MSHILVYIESNGENVSKANLPVISAAHKAKAINNATRMTAVLLGGEQTAQAAESVAAYGFDEVVYVSESALATYDALTYEDAFLKLIEMLSPQMLIVQSTSRGRDFLPRISAKKEAPQASDVIDFVAPHTYRRPMYAGNIIADVLLSGDFQCVSVRGSAYDQPVHSSTISQVKRITLDVVANEQLKVVSFDTVVSERPELGEADIVISGGRALKSAENFEKILFPLADTLHAAIGASRAAVDSGYAPNDWQVGQTGKIVAPKLYIAVGISGAVQHLAGMKDSKVIVAINKDPDAPIFEVADYGLVADLFEVVPKMNALLK